MDHRSGSEVPLGQTLPRMRVLPSGVLSARSFIVYHTFPFHSKGMLTERFVSGCQLSIHSFCAFPASTRAYRCAISPISGNCRRFAIPRTSASMLELERSGGDMKVQQG